MRWWKNRWGRRGPKPIKPLRGAPYENIPKWCYEKNKRMKENPLTGKTRKVKEKEIKIPQLQKTLRALVDRMNQVIHWITQIPILKRRVIALEEKQERDHQLVLSMIAANTMADVGHRRTPSVFAHNSYASGRRFGRYSSRNNMMEAGGKFGFSKPVPTKKKYQTGGTIRPGDTLIDDNYN